MVSHSKFFSLALKATDKCAMNNFYIVVILSRKKEYEVVGLDNYFPQFLPNVV